MILMMMMMMMMMMNSNDDDDDSGGYDIDSVFQKWLMMAISASTSS